MRDYLTIGPVPCDEPCIQLGRPHYSTISRLECNAYRKAVIEAYGLPPGESTLSIKGFQHDFGTYHELVVNYDPNNEEECAYALKVESGLETWPEDIYRQLVQDVKDALNLQYEEVIDT